MIDIFQKIRELNLGNEPVIGVNDNSSVLDALSLMSKFKFNDFRPNVLTTVWYVGTHGVSSVAVLRGKTVLGNISMTDVKVWKEAVTRGQLIVDKTLF